MTDHAEVALAGIVPDRKDNLLYAIQHLEPEHFPNAVQQGIWKAIERYYDIAGGVLPKKTLADLLGRSKTMDASTALLYEQTYEGIENLAVTDHDFRYSIDALKQQRAHQLTGEALTTAFEILERGAEVGKETLKGDLDARKFFREQDSTIERMSNVEVAPEGDMRHEGSDVLTEYFDRKNGKTEQGVQTGIKSLDKLTGGFDRGELSLICAYTNQGKTQLCCQIAWHAAVMQGKNVFFATSETVRVAVRRRLVARHSRLPQFGLTRGLNANDIKNGTLAPEEEKALKMVVDDLDHNPNYGMIYLSQIPSGATMSYWQARMNRQGSMWQIDLSVMDYFALLKSDRKRNSEREEFNEILKDAKVFSQSFNEGKGVPLVSPWQLKQEAYKAAQLTGAYGLASLSDTSEAEKSPDLIATLLAMPEQPNQLSLQLLKVRDGEVPNYAFQLETDFRNAYLGDKKQTSSFTAKGSFGLDL